MRQEELLRIMSKNAKISTEDMAAMLEASEEEIQETIEDGSRGHHLWISDADQLGLHRQRDGNCFDRSQCGTSPRNRI